MMLKIDHFLVMVFISLQSKIYPVILTFFR